MEFENKAHVPNFTNFKFWHFRVGKKNAHLLFLLFTQKRQQLGGTVLPTEKLEGENNTYIHHKPRPQGRGYHPQLTADKHHCKTEDVLDEWSTAKGKPKDGSGYSCIRQGILIVVTST